MVFLINKYIKFVVAILICTLLIYLIFYNVFSFVCVNCQVSHNFVTYHTTIFKYI